MLKRFLPKFLLNVVQVRSTAEWMLLLVITFYNKWLHNYMNNAELRKCVCLFVSGENQITFQFVKVHLLFLTKPNKYNVLWYSTDVPVTFPSFHHELQDCRPPQMNVIVVSFDALQPNSAVLLFKTLSIRLNEALIICLYSRMNCADPAHSSRCDTHTLPWHMHLKLVFGSLSLCLNFWIIRCRTQQMKVGNEHHPSHEAGKVCVRRGDFQGPFYLKNTYLLIKVFFIYTLLAESSGYK